MTRLRRLCCALAAWPWVAAHAGPRFVTDDPEPVDLHAWENNYGATWLRTAGCALRGAVPGNRGAAYLGSRASFA